MISLLVFLFGLAAGSFLNAFIYRTEKGGSVLRGRSCCLDCKHVLSWHDLIPVLSYVFLWGKCRYCNGSISLQYPFVELAGGLLFVGTLWFALPNLTATFPVFILLGYLWIIASLLVVVFVYDLKHFIIPDKVVYPAIAFAVAYQALSGPEAFWNAAAAGVGAAVFFLAIYLLSKGRAMGFGDVKLALFMGLFLGFPVILVALALAFGAGALVGLIFIAAGKKTMRSQVPFGPFLVLGTFVALFWGNALVDFYLSWLGV